MNNKIFKNKMFFQIMTAVVIVLSLIAVRNKKRWFASNPYKMNYTKLNNINKALEKGVGPKDEKTFFIVFGSRSCGACTKHYKVLQQYNLTEDQSLKNGFVKTYVTDVDLDIEDAILIASDYIQDSSARNWTSDKNFAIDKPATPTSFFIKDGKLIDIIVGAAENKEEILSYVKTKNN